MREGNGSLPAGWVMTTLGALGQVIRGVTYKKDQAQATPGEGLVPLLRATNIAERLILDGFVYVPETVVRPEQRLRKDDILIAASSGSIKIVGKAAQLLEDWDGTFGAFCAVFRSSPVVNARYVAWFLASPVYRAEVSRLAAGININNLKREHLLTMPVPVPPLPEQDRIVALLDRLWMHIVSGERAVTESLAGLAHFEAAVFRDALAGQLVGGTAVWPTCQLGEVCEVRAGVGFPKEMQGRSTGTYPVVKVGDISQTLAAGSFYVRGARNYVEEADLKVLKVRPIPAGAVVMAKIGEAVRLNRRAILAQPSLVDNNVMAWVPTGAVTAEFLHLFSRTVRLGEQSQGGIVPSVRKSDVLLIEMPVPSRDEQHAVMKAVDHQMEAANEARRALETCLREANTLRVALLRDAMTGELSTGGSGDEASSESVHRIAASSAIHRLDGRNKSRAALVVE